MIVRRIGLVVSLLVASQLAAEWRRVPVDGGKLTCLERSAAAPYTLYACTASALYASLDDGASWRLVRAFDVNADGAVYDLAITPDGKSIFVALGYSFWGSRDGGATFEKIKKDSGGYGTVVDVSPADPKVVYAGDWKSVDGGVTFTWSKPPFEIVIARELHPTDANTLLDVRTRDLKRSTDGGTTWTTLLSEPAGSYVTVAAYDPANPQRILAGTRYGFVESLDGGATWTPRKDRIPYVQNQSNIIDAIVFDRTRPGRILISVRVPVLTRHLSASTLYESTDNGQTFRQIYKHQDGFDGIVTTPAAAAVVVVGGSRTARTTDGGTTWSEALHGIHEVYGIARFALDPFDSSRLVAVGYEKRMHTVNGGKSWSELPTFARCDTWLAFDPEKLGHALCGPEYCGRCYYESDDGGATWTERELGSGSPQAPLGAQDLVFLRGTRDTLFAGSAVVRSSDAGRNVQAIAWFQARPSAGVRFTATASTLFAWNRYILGRSTDGARNWADVTWPGNGVQPSFFAASADGASMIAGSPFAAFTSTTAGATWQSVGSNVQSCRAALFLDDGRAFLGCLVTDPAERFDVPAVLSGGTTLQTWSPVDAESFDAASRGDEVLALAFIGERLVASLLNGGLLVYEPPGPRRRSVRH